MPVNRAKFHFDNTYENMDVVYRDYLLYQIGDLSCENGYQTYLHKQTVYEITYVLSGSGSFFVDGDLIPMGKGDLFVLRKGQMHNIISSEVDPLRYFYLGFDFVRPIQNKGIEKLCQFLDTTGTFKVSHANGIQDIFVKALSEFISNDALSEILVEAYMQQIICTVYRVFNRKSMDLYRLSGSNNAEEKLVYDIIHYIDMHLESMDTLSSLSDTFGYSYTHIAQKFSAYTGENLKTYHTKRRFEKANEYLYLGYSVTRVAELMRFKSIHAFSRAYKKHFGYAPREYKKRTEPATPVKPCPNK